LTHQLVRHRLASYSQQSQRYVQEHQFDFVVPPTIAAGERRLEFEHDMLKIQEMYAKWKSYGFKNEDARFVLPNACCSEIVVSANLREWRTIFKLRCDSHAQWEIRAVMTECLELLYGKAPHVFEDLAKKFGVIDDIR
jgi:thymidylate synthase (FAD)